MKTASLLLIVLCSAYTGITLTQTNSKTVSDLKEMINFIYYIKNKIEYFDLPTSLIYSSYSSHNKDFLLFVKSLAQNGWKTTVLKNELIYLPQNITEQLLAYGETIGKSTKEEQLLLNSQCLKFLESEYKTLYSELPKKNKITMVLSFSAGIAFIILFM